MMLNRIKKLRIHILALILSMFIGGFTAINLGQDINYDLLNYHYYNPYALIHDRYDEDVAPAQVLSYNNPIIDVPSYLLISHVSPRTTAGVLGMIQGLNIWILFEIALIFAQKMKARKSYQIIGAYLVAGVSFFAAGSISEVGNTMGDNLTSILILFALWMLLYSATVGPNVKSRRYTALGAYLVMGIAVGLKLTSVVYAIGLILASLVLLTGSIKNKIRHFLLQLTLFAAGIILAGGFWFTKLWVMFGNPIFPFYNHIFKSPYYPSQNFADERWIPKNLGEGILRPYEFTSSQIVSSEQPFRDPRLAVLVTLIIAFVVVLLLNRMIRPKSMLIKRVAKEQVVFWVFIVSSYLVWAQQFGYYRYLMPIELLSGIAIVIIIYALVKKQILSTILCVVVLTIITLQTSAINWGRTSWQPSYFGVTQANFIDLKNSTVLIGGFAPLSFIVPYLPPSTHVLRVESDLTSPAMGTEKTQAKLAYMVNRDREAGRSFFALIADEDKEMSENSFKHYGFEIGVCKELAAYARQDITSKFRICNLHN